MVRSTGARGAGFGQDEGRVTTVPLSVSVVVGTYNSGPYAAAAIESALAQDHPCCDVVVVDDASTDGTQEVISR